MKRTPNAYIIYRKEHYKNIMSTYPNYTFGEISKYLGQQWRDLSYNEKTIYYNKAEQLKQLNNKNNNNNN